MSLRAITWAFAQHDTTPPQRLVLLALADHADADHESWPSIDLLIEKTGLSKATIYRALADLGKSGHIVEVKSIKGYRAWELLLSQPENDSSQSENGSSQSENRTTYRNPQGTPKNQGPLPGTIEEVWNHYISKPGKQRRPLPAQERALIKKSLIEIAVDGDYGKAADELKGAIDGCWSSDYHMKRAEYRDREGPKYDRLSQIIKGRRGQETTRERIDFFLEKAKTSAVAGSGLPSADPAVIARRKQEVQRGHRLAGDPVAMRKAEEAEAWLRTYGIETIRDEHEDGFPTFREMAETAE